MTTIMEDRMQHKRDTHRLPEGEFNKEMCLDKYRRSSDKDVMLRSYGDKTLGSMTQVTLSNGSEVPMKRKKPEVFCSLKDDDNVTLVMDNEGTRVTSHMPVSFTDINPSASCSKEVHKGLILPPKKAIKMEPVDMIAHENHAEHFGVQDEDTLQDMPMNLCIKTELCDNFEISKSTTAKCMSHSNEHINVKETLAKHVSFTIPTPNVSMMGKYRELPVESSCDLSGSSQESAHSDPHYNISSSQESADSGSRFTLSSSQGSAHGGSRYSISSNLNQEASLSGHSDSLPVWCDDENITANGKIVRTPVSRLERRRQQNREAARRLREKRKKCLDRVYEERKEFESQLINLKHENERLKRKLKPDNIELDVELAQLRTENTELREQLKEHHECKLRMEKLQKDGNELRVELVQAVQDNKRLHKIIQNHQEQCVITC